MSSRKVFLFVVLTIIFFQCKRKDEIFTSDPNARLRFSVSEVQYDTVFAELPYPVRKIKVYNPNSQALAINEVFLDQGVFSPFKILVNGQTGPIVRDLELMGGDSMLIMIELFFQAKNQTTPYRLEDVIRFRFNGQEQQIALKAVGEDALLVPPGDLACAQVWDDQKTVILLGATIVPAACTLTIQKGTQVLASTGSSLDVKGTLLITGEKGKPVYMGSVVEGKFPGQWLGIRFYKTSTNNALSWLTLANAQSGLSFVSSTSSSLVDISLDHAMFMDFTLHALDLSYVALQASNCLFMASANHLTVFSKEGQYAFKHCTWAGYSYDYYREGSCVKTRNIAGPLSLSINQSIVWGDKINELEIALGTTMDIDTSIFRSAFSWSGQHQFPNQDPRFRSPVIRNFQLGLTSPALNAGASSSVTDDLKGIARDLTPDLGCYEFVP